VPHNTVINPSFNDYFNNWTVLSSPYTEEDPFPWTIITGGWEDNQIEFPKQDVDKTPILQYAQWTAMIDSTDSELNGGAVGELWQWVNVCPGVHYGLDVTFFASVTADCYITLNISGKVDESTYPFSPFVGSASDMYVLRSDVALANGNQILLGIQQYCSSAGITSGGIGNIDTVELVPLKRSNSQFGDEYDVINGPFEDEGYNYYGDYDEFTNGG
jgi:hypothetical protein